MSAHLQRVSHGYKPHVVQELLGVSRETLRYWRTRLDPCPQRHHYSGGILFTYRVIKALVRYKHIPVETLAQCELAPLFAACDTEAIGHWRERALFLQEIEGTLMWQAAEATFDEDDVFLQRLLLRPIVAEHLTAFSALGAPVWPQPAARGAVG